MRILKNKILLLRILLGIGGLIFILIFSLNKRIDRYETNRRNCMELKKASFSGIVIDCYIDHSNRGIFKMIIDTGKGEIIHNNLCLINPEAHIEKGDSINKIKGEFEYHIFKHSEVEKKVDLSCPENFDCDYWN